jgi:hypothetical protein
MRTDYPSVIAEDLPTLRQWARRVRGRPAAVRVHALRLLKSGAAAVWTGVPPWSATVHGKWRAGGRSIGAGLKDLLREPTYPGKTSRLMPEALADLAVVMSAGDRLPPSRTPRPIRPSGTASSIPASTGSGPNCASTRSSSRRADGVMPSPMPRRRPFAPGFGTTLAENGVQRVWAFDEGRFGLRVELRKRWCPAGTTIGGAVNRGGRGQAVRSTR